MLEMLVVIVVKGQLEIILAQHLQIYHPKERKEISLIETPTR